MGQEKLHGIELSDKDLEQVSGGLNNDRNSGGVIPGSPGIQPTNDGEKIDSGLTGGGYQVSIK